MIQPPKMSPFWLASAGIGMTRNAGSLPSGSLSTRLEVMDRSAAERREAGAEDEPRVHEVGVGHDAFAQHGLGLSQVRLDQLVDELRIIGVRLSLHRLAILVAIEALSGFLSEVAELHFVCEHLGHLACLAERLACGQADIEAHGI